MRYLGWLVLLLMSWSTALAERLPVEDYLDIPVVSGFAVSGDGKALAFQLTQSKNQLFVINDWETGSILASDKKKATVTLPIWINDDMASNGYVVLHRNGKRSERLNHYLMARLAGDRGDEGVYGSGSLQVPGASLNRANTRTEKRLEVTEFPENTIDYFVDASGALRAVVQENKSGTEAHILYRANPESGWRIPAGLESLKNDKVNPFWVSGDGKLLYLARQTPDGTRGMYTYDLEQQQFKELVLGHTKYDVTYRMEAVLTPRTREVLGFYYVTDKMRAIWFDERMAAVQAALDKALPNRVNKVTSLSDNLQRMVILSASASDPGTYYQFDREKVELKPLMARLPWIVPEKMAEVRMISYPARDGLMIHGYLTLPPEREPRDLPLVVLPHPYLTGRTEWEYDSTVQFLANRGYAVLQMNFRGSSGYGEAFSRKGFHRIGAEVQDDITDGARWVIDQGIADPHRLAIMGAQFGGYSALMGAMLDPQIYRCAISISGITNWQIKKKNVANLELFKERYGDPEADAAELARVSPVNNVEKINIPLLLIYDAGQDEYKELRESFTAFTKGLKKAGKSYEILDYHNEYASIYLPKERIELLNRIEKFLQIHLPVKP
jgi:dipeptidyl aminopeptidase/acylaminoacyl peptidase